MDYPKFVNRKKELKTLKERLGSRKGELIIVYGKRRVGKTELLKQLDCIYILFRQESVTNQLRRISEELAKVLKEEYLISNPFTNWDAFFSFIRKKDLKIVFDEFPYAVNSSPSLPSILQDHWDNHLRDTSTKIILCGSSIAMMESLLGYKSPLYGRRTAQLLIEPMNFKNSTLFYKKISEENKIISFSILGGTPAYILEFDYKRSTKENLRDNILQKDAFLYNEVNFLLKEELNEPRTYFSILSAIALGKTKLNEIMNYTGLDKSTVTRYISILQELRIVKRITPITEKKPMKSRNGIYKITDNYFKFWFRYIFENLEYLDLGKTEELLSKILKDINAHIAFVFEDVCKEFVLNSMKQYILVGSWWNKDVQIDLVAVNEDKKEILFGECKWSEKLVDIDAYYRLRENSMAVDWHNSNRKERYALFAKKGFTNKMKELAKKEKVYLLTAKDIV